MTSDNKTKSLGQAIDEIINALSGLNEKDKDVAIRTACLHFSLIVPSGEFGRTPSATGGTMGQGLPSTGQNTQPPADIRSLKEQKNPSSDREMACIVAYYLQTLAPMNERQQSISTSDLRKYFMQASYPLPRAIEQTLKNAKAAGYFDTAARGRFQLNPVGYNLVVHGLPRGESAVVGTSKVRNGRRKKSPRKKSRKTKK